MGEDYASQTPLEFDWYNPHLYNYLHPLLFYKTVGFFQSRLNVEVQVKSSPQFYVHINAKVFIHAFIHLSLVPLWLLCGGEKTGESNTFYNSCTSIWVRIRPVKLHWSLTHIIRIHTNIYILYCSRKPLVFFQSRLNVEVKVNFSPQIYVHINAKLFIHAFMHLFLVRLWLLCGEKTGESNTFSYFLWYSDKGKDYTSQTRSDFDWYNPHLYNYLHPLLFYKTVFFSFSFERRSAGKFFTSILRSHKWEIIFTRFHAIMLSSTMALM